MLIFFVFHHSFEELHTNEDLLSPCFCDIIYIIPKGIYIGKGDCFIMRSAKQIEEAYLAKVKADEEAMKQEIVSRISNFLEEKFEDASNGIKVLPLEIDQETFKKMFLDSTIAIRIFEANGFRCDLNRSATPSGTAYRFTVK